MTPHNIPEWVALYKCNTIFPKARRLVSTKQNYKMPMEDIDKNEVSDNGISEDEDLMMREVIQGDADLCYLHHYLSEVFRKGDNF